MHRTVVALAVTALLLVASGCNGPIDRISWFYKPPTTAGGQNDPSDALAEHLAHDYIGTMVLTHKDESYRDRLVGLGHAKPLQYVMSFEIDTLATNGHPYGNNWGWGDEPGDQDTYAWILANHQDWILGFTSWGGTWRAYLDPGNTGFQAWAVQRANYARTNWGWDAGLFLDNLDGGLGRTLAPTYDGVTATNRYAADEPAFHAAVKSFVRAMKAGYPGTVWANLTFNDAASWKRVPGAGEDYFDVGLDGAMEEGAFVGWTNTGWSSTSQWLADLGRFEHTISRRKGLLAVCQNRVAGGPGDQARARFCYGSFLLVADGRYANFRSPDDGYSKDHWLPEHDIALGAPIGGRTQNPDGSWSRAFQRQTVTVDPVAHTVTFTPRPT